MLDPSQQTITSPTPHLLHVDLKGPLGLTFRTRTRLHLLVLGLEEGPQHEVTLVTVVLDHAELGQNAGAAAHNAAGPDQLVQVELPEENSLSRAESFRGADEPDTQFVLHNEKTLHISAR